VLDTNMAREERFCADITLRKAGVVIELLSEYIPKHQTNSGVRFKCAHYIQNPCGRDATIIIGYRNDLSIRCGDSDVLSAGQSNRGGTNIANTPISQQRRDCNLGLVVPALVYHSYIKLRVIICQNTLNSSGDAGALIARANYNRYRGHASILENLPAI
jgi:hypothetical protein